MSRREGRESETKRLNSKLEREPSPKKPRRDGKPATERTSSSNHNLDVDRTDQDQKHRRRLQDALPLEAPLESGSMVGTDCANEELSKKTDGLIDGAKHSSDPIKVPRSRSYFQHDERGSAGQGGRSFGRRAATERGWGGDLKDQSSESIGTKKTDVHDLQQIEKRTQAQGDDNSLWRHDGFFELDADAPPPVRKRPAFREKKMEPEIENTARMTAPDSGRRNRLERTVSGDARREERGGRNLHDSDRSERSFTRDRAPQRGETQRVGFPSRERFGGGGGGSRGRDRFSGRYGERNQYRPTNSIRVEKWKHDMFDEANRSPTPKNEEDQIAKVEALLSS